MDRAFYINDIYNFCKEDQARINGLISKNNYFLTEKNQRNSWEYQINLLQRALNNINSGNIAFEFTIPRIGDRVDNILYINNVVYVIEFKIGEKKYPKYAIDQAIDYALDLKNFHKASRNISIVPVLVCTDAPKVENTITSGREKIYQPILCNSETLKTEITSLINHIKNDDEFVEFDKWINSEYFPTPTIIEAAQALYNGHDVREISRSDSGSYNLGITTESINYIVEKSKKNLEKSICFVTGVPGAGKTLVGLNIANSRHNYSENDHAVFLSGNGPLVYVLREALARDENKRSNKEIKKNQAKKKVQSFIQNIHHFRDEALKSENPPPEKVVIFDEAQRAWTKEKAMSFMAQKRGKLDFNMSEPEFLISIMNRHNDWAVIICLVGGGQEINNGEAGLPAWFYAIRDHFSNWKVYASNEITDFEYTRGTSVDDLFKNINIETIDSLHLSVSNRSFRNENVSAFVKSLLDLDKQKAKEYFLQIKNDYPIKITRNIETAKNWVKEIAQGSERYGLTASSGAKRLRNFGIWVQSSIKAENWFLNNKDDVRSSYFLEETATEFDIQGLEVDWSIIAWDADYRYENGKFVSYSFIGTKWNRIHDYDKILYLKNAYRVLLTRARQGFIVFIPKGDLEDGARKPEFYDGLYQYLKEIGIEEI